MVENCTSTNQILLVSGSLQARSSNRAALRAVASFVAGLDAAPEVVWFDKLGDIPILNPDEADPVPAAVTEWREALGQASGVVIAAPEYAGALAGGIKNALDWIVGSGELYRKPVAILSSGTSGGSNARRDLARTLTWQGVYLTGHLGIVAPRTKTDSDGNFSEPTTVRSIHELAQNLIDSLDRPTAELVDRANTVSAQLGVEPGHVPPA